MSFLYKKIPKKVVYSIVLGLSLFIFTASIIWAGTLSLQADYSCDNISDLDDYTTLVKEKRLSSRKLSLLFKEWGQRGISDLPECEGKAVTSVSK
jgi:hypothetical protein